MVAIYTTAYIIFVIVWFVLNSNHYLDYLNNAMKEREFISYKQYSFRKRHIVLEIMNCYIRLVTIIYALYITFTIIKTQCLK